MGEEETWQLLKLHLLDFNLPHNFKLHLLGFNLLKSTRNGLKGRAEGILYCLSCTGWILTCHAFFFESPRRGSKMEQKEFYTADV